MNRHLTIMYTLVLAALLAVGQANFQTANASKTKESDQFAGISKASRRMPEIVPGRLLVKYRAGVSTSRRNNLMMAAGARIERDLPRLGVHAIELPEGADMNAYAEMLRSRPEVEFVEPDYLVYPVGEMVPDDPMYGSQWHLPAVSCPAAWGMTMGSDQITIALCDTGVEASHPDLASKLVPGWNIMDNNSDTSPVASHGTWTAGTAAATGNNAIGVASPALNCKIMPVRVSSRSDGAALISALAAGVTWATDHGARVASVSYMGADSGLMINAGKYIRDRGGVLVMAAGNTGTYFGAPDAPELIVVSATDSSDRIAGFSTTGSYVDVAAPGVGILTTAPGSAYQYVNGTSFSTPLVAGSIGLMMSLNPGLTPAQIDTILKVSADDLGPAGWDPGYGWGRLNIGRAIGIVEGMMMGSADTTRPALGFAQPQVGGTNNGLIGISGGERISVNALDDRAVASVSLLADGAPVGTMSSAPYTFYCDTSSYADGSQHTLTAVATDEAGNSTSIAMVVTASATFDATVPTIAFTQPVVSGGIASVGKSSNEIVEVSAQDNKSVASVSLYADGYPMGTVTAAPYRFSWNTSAFLTGSQHTLQALAGDAAGNYAAVSLTVTVKAPSDTTSPVVSFQQPLAGATLAISTGEQVMVGASDNVGVASVSLYVDGALNGSSTAAPYSFTWNTSSLAGGSQHTLRAVAADQAGNSAEASIAVTVMVRDTTAPQVSFRNPENRDRLNGNQSVSIKATDNVAVTRVEFYADNQLVMSWTRPAYSMKWSTNRLKKGVHTLTCKAYDAAGNGAASSITVTK
jgi:thermitase